MSTTPTPAQSSHDHGAPYNDADWIARIRGGEVAAFEQLVHHYADKLCAFVYNSVGDRETTQEIVQDLFLWIWRHRNEWEIRSGLTTYLYRAAHNRAVSAFRHERLERRWREEMSRGGLARMPQQADATVGEDDLRAALARAVRELPERCRQVFLLHREHHLSYAQIAETLGISPKTVEVHIGRALMALRRSLAEWL